MGLPDGNGAARRLGATLRGRRVSRGMSLRTLAKQIGLSAHGTLVDYEHGRRIPPEDLLRACEKTLGIDDGGLRRLREEALAERGDTRALALLTTPGPNGGRTAAVPAGGGPNSPPPDDGRVAPPVVESRETVAPSRARASRARLRVWLPVLATVVLVTIAVGAHVFGPTATGRLHFTFETPADRWTILWGQKKATGEVTDSLHYEGSHAYEVRSTGASEGHGPQNGYVAFGTTHGLETLHSGMRVTVHMWTSYPRNGVRFFVYGPGSTTVWAPETPDNGTELPVSGGTRWSTLTFTVPAVPVVRGIGVQPYADNDETRVVAIDAVSW
jgi:transcriptional regulator with XRE-family HTH domain